ncbi:MAG TPA: RNA-binding cell elongation regulator Jag/EloR [Anaerolineae bacterium]|jgi:spoIIIJ-associated protein
MSATEITAHDIETAIRIGLAQMDLMRAEVKIEVLDEGSKGVLGLGVKPARVRLTPYSEIETKPAGAPAVTEPPAVQPVTEPAASVPAEPVEDAEEVIVEGETETNTEASPEAEDNEAAQAKRTVTPEHVELAAALTQGVLDRMNFAATVSSRLVIPSGGEDNPSVWVDIQGTDSSRLLAHQCETLDALQLVVQSMWAHQTKSNLRVTLDADNYKERREKRIQQMAQRLAERVVSSGRAITLEPMPASERRLVHIALREHPQVQTESHGEGSGRRITIKLK